MPSRDQMADLYEVAVSLLEEAGFFRYEVSNFARYPAAESKHNKSYWQGEQYLGVGPGAHSRVVSRTWENSPNKIQESNGGAYVGSEALGKRLERCGLVKCKASAMEWQVVREAKVNAADPVSWLKETQKKGTGTRRVMGQTRLEVAAEYLASGLRTSEGVTPTRWSEFLPRTTLNEVFEEDSLWLQEKNLINLSSKGLKASSVGMNVLDSILPYLYNVLYDKLT